MRGLVLNTPAASTESTASRSGARPAESTALASIAGLPFERMPVRNPRRADLRASRRRPGRRRACDRRRAAVRASPRRPSGSGRRRGRAPARSRSRTARSVRQATAPSCIRAALRARSPTAAPHPARSPPRAAPPPHARRRACRRRRTRRRGFVPGGRRTAAWRLRSGLMQQRYHGLAVVTPCPHSWAPVSSSSAQRARMSPT